MDFGLIFSRLFPGENVHPRMVGPYLPDPHETYLMFADVTVPKEQQWRGSGPLPSWDVIQATWAAILVDMPELALPVDHRQVIIDKRAAKDAMTHTTPLIRLMRCSDRVTYKSIIQMRQAFNSLLDVLALGRFPTVQEVASLKLPIRSWSQLKQATQAEIDTDDPNN